MSKPGGAFSDLWLCINCWWQNFMARLC